MTRRRWTWPLFLLGAAAPAAWFPGAARDHVTQNEPEERDFEEMVIGDLLVYFHQRMVRHVTVMGDYIVYQFDRPKTSAYQPCAE